MPRDVTNISERLNILYLSWAHTSPPHHFERRRTRTRTRTRSQEVEIVLDIKNDGVIHFTYVDGCVLVDRFEMPKKGEMFKVNSGDSVCSINGYSVSGMTFQEINDHVHKCDLGLVALRFRRSNPKFPPIKVGTQIMDKAEKEKKKRTAEEVNLDVSEKPLAKKRNVEKEDAGTKGTEEPSASKEAKDNVAGKQGETRSVEPSEEKNGKVHKEDEKTEAPEGGSAKKNGDAEPQSL